MTHTNVIELINQLQTLNLSMDLPSLVVIGAQSSGKSSLINHLCGYEVLPIGMDMVTKQPLILQLVHIENEDDYAEFHHLQESIDVSQVQHELIALAEKVQYISSNPIYLKLYSKHVVNLTLVDLPGLIQIPTIHQPSDLDDQIYQLVSHHAKKDNALLLAISTCMNDLSTSDALRLCRSVDPDGKRTIGVLTKCDQLFTTLHENKGIPLQGLKDVLTGKTYPLLHGFTAVINLPGNPGEFQSSHLHSRELEHQLFSTHFPSIAHKCGVNYLQQLLNKILTNHIKQQMPELKSKITLLTQQSQSEYDQFGPLHEISLSSLLRILSSYADRFTRSIEGQATTLELCAGARIYYLFHTVFVDHLRKVSPLDQLTDHDIKTAIRNATGPRTTLFIPERAFELLIKPQLKRLEGPALKCLDLCYHELLKVSLECCSKDISRYPYLSAQLTEIVEKLLLEKLGPTKDYVSSLVRIQASYINTNHPDFIGVGAAMERPRQTSVSSGNRSPDKEESEPQETLLQYFFKKQKKQTDGFHLSSLTPVPGVVTSNQFQQQDLTEKEHFEVALIRKLMTSYFEIVRESLLDLVPKAIMHCLVNSVCDDLHPRLVEQLYMPDKLTDYFLEDDMVAKERSKVLEKLTKYKQANEILNSI